MNNSSLTQSKIKQGYINRLNKQIQTIELQAKTFNIREKARSLNNKKCFLKTLSQPKYQHTLVNMGFIPEKKELQVDTKINKFFQNCSTLSQGEFFANPQLMSDGTSSKLIQSRTRCQTAKERKMNINYQKLQKNWGKIDKFRISYDMGNEGQNLAMNRKINSILQKVEKRRPLTAVGVSKISN